MSIMRLRKKKLTTLSVKVPVLSKHTMLTLAAILSALEYSRVMPALSSLVRAMCVSSRYNVGMVGGAEWVRVSKIL